MQVISFCMLAYFSLPSFPLKVNLYHAHQIKRILCHFIVFVNISCVNISKFLLPLFHIDGVFDLIRQQSYACAIFTLLCIGIVCLMSWADDENFISCVNNTIWTSTIITIYQLLLYIYRIVLL